MSRIQLLWLDEDIMYAENMMAFIRSTEFADKLQVKLFTKLEYVEKLLESDKEPYVLLISESFLPYWKGSQTSVLVLHLSNSLSMSAETKEEAIQSVYRFQPLHQLLTRVLAYYGETNQASMAPSKKGTQVISLYSSVGNSGKTATSLHLAKQLAFRGKRVFYLNLESLSSVSQFLPGGDQQYFSQILYYLRSSPALLGPKLELLKSYDPSSGLDFLTPCNHIREAQEMSGEDIRLLVEALVGFKSYDYVILDLESSLHFRIMKALEISDHVLWLLMDDLNCLHKTVALRKAIASRTGVHYILNKFTGSLYNDFESIGVTIKGYLPYIPEWKTVHAPEQIWSASVFSDQVYELFSNLDTLTLYDEVPA
jgi:cellulose biosynthesis protein BcsQ